MKSFAAALLAGANATLLSSNDFKFMQHVAEYNLQFETVDEYNFRFDAFMVTDAEVEELLANPDGTCTHGHNEFSHWTRAEKLARNGFVPSQTLHSDEWHMEDPNEVVPNNVNWVTKGAVTAVKNQKQCGSCWAFSTTGAMEGMYQINHGKLISRSEQELVSCDTYSSGCNGGNFSSAFKWLQSTPLNTESAYPYTSGTGKTGSCNKSLEKSGINDKSHVNVQSKSDSALVSAINKQPVSIVVDAQSSYWNNYKSGTMTNYNACGTRTDHAILAVGYTSSAYYVKNSWGTSWGEKGYAYVGRNVKGQPSVGVCAILAGPAYPRD